MPLATGRCEWRAAPASKSAGLRRDVADVPVETPQKSETARGKVRVSGLLLGGQVRHWPQKPCHPHPLFLFRSFSVSSRWLSKPVVGPRFRGLPEPVIHHKGTNPRTGRGVSPETSRGASDACRCQQAHQAEARLQQLLCWPGHAAGQESLVSPHHRRLLRVHSLPCHSRT